MIPLGEFSRLWEWRIFRTESGRADTTLLETKMKKVLLPMTMFAALVAFGAPMASASVVSTGSAECAVASVKIINDTDGDIQLHTGHGFVELNKGASTSITCEPGTKISRADKGKKGAVIFEIDESMCGKVVKLSKYL
jgi:hypothetical protein